MATPWIISTDLDGTLLHPNGQVSSRACQVLQELHNRGHIITLASGRHWDDMLETAERIDVPCVLIGSNGAWIGTASGASFAERTLPAEAAEIVVETVAELPAVVIVTLRHERFIVDTGNAALIEELKTPTGSLERVQGQGIFKLTVVTKPAMLETTIQALRERFVDTANVVSTDARTIDINAKGVSKGEAIRWLSEQRGVDIAHTLAFGNEMNDVSMLATAGIGVAVADAHPALFEFADKTTAPSYEDGVAQWLQSFFEVDVLKESG